MLVAGPKSKHESEIDTRDEHSCSVERTLIILMRAATIDFAPRAGAFATICHGVLCLFAVASTKGPAVPFPPAPVRCIAEFEPMEGALVIWPLGIPADLMREISKDALVFCATNNATAATEEFTDCGVVMEHVRFIPATPDPGSFYTRDFGPLWIADGNGAIGIVDPIYDVGERVNGDRLNGTVSVEALGLDPARLTRLSIVTVRGRVLQTWKAAGDGRHQGCTRSG